MANVVAEVRKLATAALKKNHPQYGVVQAPSKWASAAGFDGSEASALRVHIARASDNGCGRQGRYPKVDAEGMIELLDLGDQFKAAEGAKAQAVSKRIHAKLGPAAKAGAKAAKTQAKRASSRKQTTKSAA